MLTEEIISEYRDFLELSNLAICCLSKVVLKLDNICKEDNIKNYSKNVTDNLNLSNLEKYFEELKDLLEKFENISFDVLKNENNNDEILYFQEEGDCEEEIVAWVDLSHPINWDKFR